MVINGNSIDGLRGIRTQDRQVEGVDKSTELWRTQQLMDNHIYDLKRHFSNKNKKFLTFTAPHLGTKAIMFESSFFKNWPIPASFVYFRPVRFTMDHRVLQFATRGQCIKVK